jgi:hypothetical protein
MDIPADLALQSGQYWTTWLGGQRLWLHRDLRHGLQGAVSACRWGAECFHRRVAMANPVQRAWRDVNAVGRHIRMNWDAVGTMHEQMALGLEPQGRH